VSASRGRGAATQADQLNSIFSAKTDPRENPEKNPVDYYLVPSGIWAPSGYHLVLGKPPSGATSSGKDLGPMLF
jgi:hypothetical protein